MMRKWSRALVYDAWKEPAAVEDVAHHPYGYSCVSQCMYNAVRTYRA